MQAPNSRYASKKSLERYRLITSAESLDRILCVIPPCAFTHCLRASPFLENDGDGADDHDKAHQIVPFQRFTKVEH